MAKRRMTTPLSKAKIRDSNVKVVVLGVEMRVNKLKTSIFEIVILRIGDTNQADTAIVNEERVNRGIILLKRTFSAESRILISRKIISRFLRGKSTVTAEDESSKHLIVNLPPFLSSKWTTASNK